MEKTITLSCDLYSTYKKLTDAQFSALMRAAFEYRISGAEYSGGDIIVEALFQAIKAQEQAMDGKRLTGLYGAYRKQQKKGGNAPLPFDEWLSEVPSEVPSRYLQGTFKVPSRYLEVPSEGPGEQEEREKRERPSPPKKESSKERNTPLQKERIEKEELTPPLSPPSGGAHTRAKGRGEPKVQWAEFVAMTNDEHDKLLATYGPADTKRLIEILDNYKGSTGKKYLSDYRAILNWCIKRLATEKQESGAVPAHKAVNPFAEMVRRMEEEGIE